MDTLPFRGLDPVLTSRFPAFSRHSDRWSFHGSLPRSLTAPRTEYNINNLVQPPSAPTTGYGRNYAGSHSRSSDRNSSRRSGDEIVTLPLYRDVRIENNVPLLSNTLPRNVGYGRVTGSRFVDNANSYYSDPRRTSLSPERYHHNNVNNIYNSYTDGDISSRRHRRNRSLSPRRPQSNNRYRTWGGSDRSGSRTHPIYSGEHDVNPGIETIRSNYKPSDVNYYTYSDDEKDFDYSSVTPTGKITTDENSSISVKEIDFMVLENARAHHTDKFCVSRDAVPVLRRGQKFVVSIVLNQKISLTQHNIVFLFTTGKNPQPGKGTYIYLSSAVQQHPEGWTILVDKVFHDRVTFAIQTPPTTIIGEWKILVGVNVDSIPEMLNPKPTGSIIILFNPWEKDDAVFFPEVTKLSEYILNDSGVCLPEVKFEPDVLAAALYCVDKAFNFRSGRAKGDPVRVARVISKIVNSNDDNGVVMGNWSSNYGNGTPPLSWIGSVKILRQFLKTSKPVKYGQCFVFAGVVTTICRALGIPCRTVTNFSSAHDTDGSVTVDVHWDSHGDKPITETNTDSIWNFHVWNDVWMKRKDLPVGNDGWQVLDATPQETSDGEFRCGPAPLSAILNGRCDVGYDAAFIYAEVNADRVHWSKSPDGSWQVIGIDEQVVGKTISTKVADGRPIPGNISDCEKYREDITHEYKYPEGSDRERISVLTASTRASSDVANKYVTCKDIKFEIHTPKQVFVGSSFDVLVVCTNISGVQQTIIGRVICDVTKYTGSVIKALRDEAFERVIEAYEQEQIILHFEPEDYVDHVTEAAMFKLSMISKVKDTNQQFATIKNFRLLLPDLVVKARGSFPSVGQSITLDISFTNPLTKRSLTNCVLQAECAGMKEECTRKLWNILPGEDLQTSIDVTPSVRGVCPVYVTFYCDKLHDLKGTCELFIQ